jgi:hypothetical protein
MMLSGSGMPMPRINFKTSDTNPEKIRSNAIQRAESVNMPFRSLKQVLYAPVSENEPETISIRYHTDALHAPSTNQFSEGLRIDGIHHDRNHHNHNNNDYIKSWRRKYKNVGHSTVRSIS